MHVLGIDAGGTKTVALLADGDGRILGEGRAGAANLQTEGELEVEKILHTVIELVAGAGASPGIVVISGTGAIAYGVSHHGVAARAGGWGPTLGDEGSGYWIGRRALAAVMRDADGRGPHTDLTRLVLRHFSLPPPETLGG